jgi:hypothetical protein
VTECGLDASKAPTVTREEFFQRVRDWGSQRCMMTICMTCAQTARNHKTWAEDPRSAIAREVAWETRWGRSEVGRVLWDELLAIEALIAAHREEFDAHLVATQQRRDWIDRKAAFEKSKVKP